ncbi:hypothetical protein HJG60_010366 [Phyllostomus discolor]|uniref:Uncharacterized protein n=1 Tax=Phyllostomus discolor TaxID=89673 RepID=A0A834EGI9_9CHIR|nr:hypothetical protein HJG60_010366 [Phyllostomus discolor]
MSHPSPGTARPASEDRFFSPPLPVAPGKENVDVTAHLVRAMQLRRRWGCPSDGWCPGLQSVLSLTEALLKAPCCHWEAVPRAGSAGHPAGGQRAAREPLAFTLGGRELCPQRLLVPLLCSIKPPTLGAPSPGALHKQTVLRRHDGCFPFVPVDGFFQAADCTVHPGGHSPWGAITAQAA